MPSEEGGKAGGDDKEGEEAKPVQDQTELLIKKIAAQLGERSINYVLVVDDGASPRWIISDIYWALGVFQLIKARTHYNWDMNMIEAEADDDEEDE